MDGFQQEELRARKGDEGAEVASRFLASESDLFEALELADELLDAGAGPIEHLRKEPRRVLLALPCTGSRGRCALSRAAARFLRFA